MPPAVALTSQGDETQKIGLFSQGAQGLGWGVLWAHKWENFLHLSQLSFLSLLHASFFPLPSSLFSLPLNSQLLAGSQHCSCLAPLSPPPSLSAPPSSQPSPWHAVAPAGGQGSTQDLSCPVFCLLLTLPFQSPLMAPTQHRRLGSLGYPGPWLFLMPPAQEINIPPLPPAVLDGVTHPFPIHSLSYRSSTHLNVELTHPNVFCSHSLLVSPSGPWTPCRKTA